jgi:signal transduction histidine kinase
MRILIVDGSREQRQHLVHVLGAVTNVVIQGAVADMRSALSAVAEAQPDVIVTGCALPDGDGAQLIEHVRRLAQTPSFVVVAGAENDNEVERERYLAVGVDRYVESGSDSRALQVAVTTLRRRPAGSLPPAETQRLIGRMTSGVVHDLNNYIHVLDVTMMLLRRHPEDPQLWAQSQAALQAMSRLNAMLLSYARGSEVTPVLVDLGIVARETVATLGRVVPPNVTVAFDIHDKLPPVQAVRAELEQMLLNLVVNACDAMAQNGGVLTISIRRSAASVVVLDISDTGAGMSRAIDGHSTKRPGIGLGLGIVQAVVDRHKGALSITSRETGGTKVVVMLPAAHN